MYQNITTLLETALTPSPPASRPSLVLAICNNADKLSINSLKTQQGLLCKPHMPNSPQDLTVLTLTHTTGAQLKYWIDGANREAGKRVLTKAGRVDKLCQRLAGYYGLDLSSLPAVPVPAGPPACDVEIQRRQWDHL